MNIEMENEDIQPVINQQSTPETPPVIQEVPDESVAMPKKTFIVFPTVILLILVSLFTGYLLYQNHLLKQQVIKLTTKQTVAASPTATPDPTTSWETFVFEPIGHIFKYPTGWTAVQCEQGVYLFAQPTQRTGTSCETPPFGEILISFNQKPIENGYLKSSDYILEREENITLLFGLAIKKVIKETKESPGPKNYIQITFKGINNYYYSISSEDLQYEIILDQILSTFQFTN